MSCSKEFRYPNNWVKVGQDALARPFDESLIEAEELINWMLECGVCDEKTVRKYLKNLKPFESMRSFCPIFPYTKTWRALFKIITQFINTIFVIDDIMEKDYNLSDMEKVTNAYYQLDEKMKKMFPSIPSVAELQQSLQYLSDPKMISIVTVVMDCANRTTRVLLQDGDLSADTIFNYRNRLSNGLSLYLQGVKAEKVLNTGDTDEKLIWRRIFGAAGNVFILTVEASSGCLGKVSAHRSEISELYNLFALYVGLLNDVYSYEREESESIECESLLRIWREKNDNPNASTSADYKALSILDSVAKYVYKRGEEIKAKNANNPELHDLLDQIGYGIAGCYFMHAHASDRYRDCHMPMSVKGLEGNELQKWLDEDDPFGQEVVKQFSVEHSCLAKKMIDVISGVISASGQLP